MCAEITSKQDPGPCGGVGVQGGALVVEEGSHMAAAKVKLASRTLLSLHSRIAVFPLIARSSIPVSFCS